MVSKIRKVGVVGAGVMGAGIAAQVANAGFPVVLLDIVPDGSDDRSAIARGALGKLKKARPPALMSKKAGTLISVGNVEDDLGLLADVDLIIEAVAENLEIKRNLYIELEKVKKAEAIVSSNTSTIRCGELMGGFSEEFKSHFVITHFFNPPRYMRLLEVVSGPDTAAEIVSVVSNFTDRNLGKTVVVCRDTPGFIANRIGVCWLNGAVQDAAKLGLSVEEADAIAGRPMGIPATGVFGLIDLIGLDVMDYATTGLLSALPESDPAKSLGDKLAVTKGLIAKGNTGRKAKAGYYRVSKSGSEKIKETVDLKTGVYSLQEKVDLASLSVAKKGGLRALLEETDKGGQYAWAIVSKTLAYAASLIPETTDNISDIDEAMRLGYNWGKGPFELMDELGAVWFKGKLEAEGLDVPPLLATAAEKGGFYVEKDHLEMLGPDGAYKQVPVVSDVLLLSEFKKDCLPVLSNKAASLWDIGDGIVCLEFHTKMNALEEATLEMVELTVKEASLNFKGIVIYNDGPNFSAGANLNVIRENFNVKNWNDIEKLIKRGQAAFKALLYAPVPVVGAPSGLALGGGCEILLHCDHVQAHAETYMGLVEVGVGLVPGWGGCKEMLTRLFASGLPSGPVPPIKKAFEAIAMAKVSQSAFDAKDIGYLRATDDVTMNRVRLLADAKSKAMELAGGYAPREPIELRLPGNGVKASLVAQLDDMAKVGRATPHDQIIGGELANLLCGDGTDVVDLVTEDAISTLECNTFMSLVQKQDTQARVNHMLDTGKALRN